MVCILQRDGWLPTCNVGLPSSPPQHCQLHTWWGEHQRFPLVHRPYKHGRVFADERCRTAKGATIFRCILCRRGCCVPWQLLPVPRNSLDVWKHRQCIRTRAWSVRSHWATKLHSGVYTVAWVRWCHQCDASYGLMCATAQIHSYCNRGSFISIYFFHYHPVGENPNAI